MNLVSFITLVLIIGVPIGILVIILIDGGNNRKRRREKRYFSLAVLFKPKNKFKMPTVNSITLTDLIPHNGAIVLTDNFGNEYTGTLSNAQLTDLDTSQDEVTIDPNDPNQLDVQSLGQSGATTCKLTGDWTSQGNTTSRPNSNPKLPGSQEIADGTAMTGLSCEISITNSISRTFALKVNFQ